MLSGFILVFLILLFFAFFIVYKKDMLSKMFALHANVPANEFREELERTANTVIKRLEMQISHLEFLLEEADAKIDEMDKKIQAANKTVEQMTVLPASPVETAGTLSSAVAADSFHSHSGTVSSDEPEVSPQVPAKDVLVHDKRRLILAMSTQGYNATEISKATGVSKGEIMLLLQLNKK